MISLDIVREKKVELFSNMVLCCHTLYYTVFKNDEQILYQNAPDEFPLELLFRDIIDQIFSEYTVIKDTQPILLSSEIGISWLIQPIPEDDCIHALGPFFLSDISASKIEEELEKRHLSLSVKHKALKLTQELPVISLNRILEYAVMLHYFLFEEKISIDSVISSKHQPTIPSLPQYASNSINHGTYEAEQEMLRLVREGDLNYRAHMNKIAVTGTLGKLNNGDPTRQIKNSILVAITLFSRAAIDGGLNPEISYALTDYYFQSVEACDDLSDLTDIMHSMQEDFIQRVHACRILDQHSVAVRSCIEYIDYHLEEPIDLKELMQSLGYNDSYFSKKFKKETGLSPKDYLLKKRFERAAFLLEKTTTPLSEIAAKLQFCSQSYFTEQFKKCYLMTPDRYREAHALSCTPDQPHQA